MTQSQNLTRQKQLLTARYSLQAWLGASHLSVISYQLAFQLVG